MSKKRNVSFFFHNLFTFFPVKNCVLKGESFAKTMKLGVPALTKNLQTKAEKTDESKSPSVTETHTHVPVNQ